MRPYVVVSAAMSVDGYLDDAEPQRLVLSGEADLDRVDAVRASCDAILVGAGTVRADDPRLRVRSAERRRARLAAGMPASPLRVVLTRGADLPSTARVFDPGADRPALLLVTTPAFAPARDRFTGVADVVDIGASGDAEHVLTELTRCGVRRLMVEGGASVNTMFLAAGAVDELHVAVAPFLVGDSRAPRLACNAAYRWNAGNRARLLGAGTAGDMAVLRYGLSERAGPGA